MEPDFDDLYEQYLAFESQPEDDFEPPQPPYDEYDDEYMEVPPQGEATGTTSMNPSESQLNTRNQENNDDEESFHSKDDKGQDDDDSYISRESIKGKDIFSFERYVKWTPKRTNQTMSL